MKITSKISPKYLTTIPKPVVRFLKLRVGDEIEYQQHGKDVLIRKSKI